MKINNKYTIILTLLSAFAVSINASANENENNKTTSSTETTTTTTKPKTEQEVLNEMFKANICKDYPICKFRDTGLGNNGNEEVPEA